MSGKFVDLCKFFLKGIQTDDVNNRLVDDYVHFTASFPYQEYVMDGLTIAAVTNSVGPFSDASDVAAATLYGPGIIELA